MYFVYKSSKNFKLKRKVEFLSANPSRWCQSLNSSVPVQMSLQRHLPEQASLTDLHRVATRVADTFMGQE